MAIKEEFEIIISKNGEMRIQAKGFTGQTCKLPLEDLKVVLKAQDSRIEHTEEYYRESTHVESKIKEK